MLLLSACGNPTPTTTNVIADPTATAAPSVPEASDSAVVPTGTMVLAAEGALTNLSNAATDETTIQALPFIFNGLYRLDPSFAPVPDLAAEPCQVSNDALTWTCTLTDATFHNGDRLTSEDVAYTYQLAMSPSCTFRTALCLSSVLDDVRAADESTVVFTLETPYAPFATLVLPEIKVESKAVIERAHASLLAEARALDLRPAGSLIEDLERFELGAYRPSACADVAARAEDLIRGAPSLRVPDRDSSNFGGEDGVDFDPCAYASALEPALRALAAASEAGGVDAVAAAYALLGFNAEPVGTGPWRCMPGCLRPDESLTLKAFDGYFRGPAATKTIEMPVFADELAAMEALRAGDVDWVRDIGDDARASVLDGEPEVRLGAHPDLGTFSLQYNLREGQVFADLGARKAVQHCIDKAALVEAATHGPAIPVEGYITPGSWAYSRLPTTERDTRAGMDFLRQAGWNVEDDDDDGIADAVATRGDKAFRTSVFVRGGQPERIVFMERLRDQVIDCGIELEVLEGHIPLVALLTFPHVLPGTEGQFDAYFGGWGGSPEPDPYLIFHSSQCTTAEQPDLYNYICFTNDRADALIEEGRRVSDLDKRAMIYRELQEVLYEQQPYLFAWSDLNVDAVDANLTSSAGPIDFRSPLWHWQLETLLVDQ